MLATATATAANAAAAITIIAATATTTTQFVHLSQCVAIAWSLAVLLVFKPSLPHILDL